MEAAEEWGISAEQFTAAAASVAARRRGAGGVSTSKGVRAASRRARLPSRGRASAGSDRDDDDAAGDGAGARSRPGSARPRAAATPTSDEPEEARALLADAGDDPQAAAEGLIAAVRDGKTGVVHELLAAGVAVSRKAKSDGSTALHCAAARGATHTAGMLLARDAPVGATNREGWTPLHLAASHGHVSVARKLLEAGADVGAIELGSNKTALHYAALNGHADVASLLLASGAEAEAMNHEGTTPLHEAAYGGHATLIRMLLAAGASPDGTPQLGAELALASKSLSAAVRLNCGGLFSCVIPTPKLDQGGDDRGAFRRGGAAGGATPLHWAVRRAAGAGNCEAIGVLLAAGATVDAADSAGETPLHKAASHGDAEVCERLLDAGASLEARSRGGGTPLRAAAAAGQVVTCMVLLAAGADMGDASEAMSAAAAATGDAAALLAHVRAWCAEELTQRPEAGRGFLTRTRCLQKAAVRTMIMRKAALDGLLTDAELASAAVATVDAVVVEAQLRAMQVELQAGTLQRDVAVDAAVAAVAALEEGAASALRRTFCGVFDGAAEGADAPGLAGSTPLHRAATRGDAEALLSLLGAGGDANAADAEGRTPLHAAAAAGSAQACKVLLAGGASLEARYRACAAYVPHERVSALVYGTAATFGGGTPADVAVGDAVAVLAEAAKREAAKREARAGGGAARVASPAMPAPAPAPVQQQQQQRVRPPRAMSPAPPATQPAPQRSAAGGRTAGRHTPVAAQPSRQRLSPPAVSLERAEADATAAAEAAALALEAEMDADAAAREDPTPANRAAAAAAARVAVDRAAAAAAAQLVLSEARLRESSSAAAARGAAGARASPHAIW